MSERIVPEVRANLDVLPQRLLGRRVVSRHRDRGREVVGAVRAREAPDRPDGDELRQHRDAEQSVRDATPQNVTMVSLRRVGVRRPNLPTCPTRSQRAVLCRELRRIALRCSVCRPTSAHREEQFDPIAIKALGGSSGLSLEGENGRGRYLQLPPFGIDSSATAKRRHHLGSRTLRPPGSHCRVVLGGHRCGGR